MGREKAIEYLKNYIDQQKYQSRAKLVDLDHFWDEKQHGHYYRTGGISFRFNKGKIAFRDDKCLSYELMKPLSDPELAYIICCYGDTAGVEASNSNFVFTRSKTLIEGDSYCDPCMHDKRYVSQINHPRDEFYRSLDAEIKSEEEL
jgi:hypothetical protein